MSPEQAQGNRMVDSRSDLWAIGVIAFECLTGKRPFYSDGLGDLVLAICVRDIPLPSSIASVPIGFDAWWNRAVARDPEKRFQTAKELTEALREALGLEPKDSGRESPRAAPDIEVTTAPDTARDAEETPPTDPVAALQASAIQTAAAFTVRADDAAEPNAATVVAAPVPLDLPALTERQFGTTQKSLPSSLPRSSDGTGIVIGVAAAALFVGLIAGVLLLRSRVDDGGDPKRALPPPEPAAVRQPSEPKIKPKAAQPSLPPSASAAPEPPLLEFLPGDAPEAAPTATPPAEPPVSVKPEPAAPVSATPPSVTPPPSSSAPWVKPDWAIPDEDPVRHEPIKE
jgi:eukaryotic-like serine/threonine-protein kinase